MSFHFCVTVTNAGQPRFGRRGRPEMPRAQTARQAQRDAGFTLVETLVALFIVTIILLAIAELMTYGLYVHQSGEDLTETAALAAEKLEELRNRDYLTLAPGGSLAVNSAGFFDDLDIDTDGTPDYSRRWEITDLGDRKRIEVRVIAAQDLTGGPKETTLATLVAQ